MGMESLFDLPAITRFPKPPAAEAGFEFPDKRGIRQRSRDFHLPQAAPFVAAGQENLPHFAVQFAVLHNGFRAKEPGYALALLVAIVALLPRPNQRGAANLIPSDRFGSLSSESFLTECDAAIVQFDRNGEGSGTEVEASAHKRAAFPPFGLLIVDELGRSLKERDDRHCFP